MQSKLVTVIEEIIQKCSYRKTLSLKFLFPSLVFDSKTTKNLIKSPESVWSKNMLQLHTAAVATDDVAVASWWLAMMFQAQSRAMTQSKRYLQSLIFFQIWVASVVFHVVFYLPAVFALFLIRSVNVCHE